jgi:hypothetical protein
MSGNAKLVRRDVSSADFRVVKWIVERDLGDGAIEFVRCDSRAEAEHELGERGLRVVSPSWKLSGATSPERGWRL